MTNNCQEKGKEKKTHILISQTCYMGLKKVEEIPALSSDSPGFRVQLCYFPSLFT
jgi:hypothetical protein